MALKLPKQLRLALRAKILIALALFGGMIGFVPQTFAATGVMDDNVYLVVNPTTKSSALVLESDLARFTANGYSESSVALLGSNESGTGLNPIYRLYKPSNKDYLMTASSNERNSALTKYGYTDDGIAFYARYSDDAASEPVYRYLKGSSHRSLQKESDWKALEADGWKREAATFYAIPAPVTPPQPPTPPTPPTPTHPGDGDGKFSIAVMPDTQQEVFEFSGDQFAERTQWITSQATSRDIRFVAHTGDIVSAGGNSTDTQNLYQFEKASSAFTTIDNSGLPYLVSAGNHDTAAVCGGGSACPGQDVRTNIRDTRVLNQYFSSSRLQIPLTQEFESNKIDNSYKMFTAEGTKWLVLSFEMHPRVAAVTWAKQVIEAHPDYNVIVTSHYLLEADGSIATSNGYGETSGRYIYDNVVLRYPNVKLAFSGHVGSAATRTDVGQNGNTVASFVGAFHQNDYNPTRIVTIDVNGGSVTSDIQAASIRDAYKAKYPATTLPTYDEYDVTYSGLNFIRQ